MEQAYFLPLLASMGVIAAAIGHTAIWPTEAGMESEGDISIKGVTGLILMMMMPGVIGSMIFLGLKGPTGFWDVITFRLPELASVAGLREDLLAHCVGLDLAQRTRADASASFSAATAGDSPLRLAIGVPRSRPFPPRWLAARVSNRPTIHRGSSKGWLGRPSRGGSAAARGGADRLKIWRGALSTAASSSSTSCAAGRAYGPERWLAMLLSNSMRTRPGARASGPGLLRTTFRLWGCRASMEGRARFTSQLPPE